jgi:small ligand-binding sensory domain FIST
MRFVSAISRQERTEDAVRECIERLTEELEDPDLLVAFVSRHHVTRAGTVSSQLADRFENALVAGCAGWSVIGAGEEVEREPAVSVTAAKLPGVRLRAQRVRDVEELGEFDDQPVAFMVLIDSFTTDADALVEALDEGYPDATQFGGFAHGGVQPRTNAMFLGEEAGPGSVVVSFSGELRVDTIVAQGCRPIGQPLVVERSRDNLILEFDRGRPADVLQDLFATLPPDDQRLFPQALHAGLAVREPGGGDYRRGDYLLRPILGIDPNSGSMAVNERVSNYDRVQFHLRDKEASSADLAEWIDQYLEDDVSDIRGALLFSCVGRGVDLYGVPDHDTGMFQERVADVPVGGFFCNGEVGPVGERTFLHAYTSTFAVFRPGRDE